MARKNNRSNRRSDKTQERGVPRGRNWIAVQAHFRTGAGNHGDKRKEDSKRACRGRVKWE